MKNVIESLPLLVFLLLLNFTDTDVPRNWQVVFISSGVVAFVVIFSVMFRKEPSNRLFLGINLYLISGGAAFVTHQWWLNEIYGRLQASGMLLWVIAVGGIATLCSSHGFIGADSPDRQLIRKYSLCLLLVAVAAFAVSYFFQGNRFLSEILPFVGLFLLGQEWKNTIEKRTT